MANKKQKRDAMKAKRIAKEQKNLHLKKNDRWDEKKLRKNENFESRLISDVKDKLRSMPEISDLTNRQFVIQNPSSGKSLTVSYSIMPDGLYVGKENNRVDFDDENFRGELLNQLSYDYNGWNVASGRYARRGFGSWF